MPAPGDQDRGFCAFALIADALFPAPALSPAMPAGSSLNKPDSPAKNRPQKKVLDLRTLNFSKAHTVRFWKMTLPDPLPAAQKIPGIVGTFARAGVWNTALCGHVYDTSGRQFNTGGAACSTLCSPQPLQYPCLQQPGLPNAHVRQSRNATTPRIPGRPAILLSRDAGAAFFQKCTRCTFRIFAKAHGVRFCDHLPPGGRSGVRNPALRRP